MNDQTPKLNAALAAAQGEMPHVEFDATNPFLKNKFASLGAVISTSKPILAKHGLSIEQMPVSEAGAIGVRTTLRHASGETASGTISLPLAEERGKSQAQVAGSIITYLRRYSWASVLGMYADEDNDGHAVEPRPMAARTTPQPAPAVPAAREFTVGNVVLTGVAEKTGENRGKKWTAYFVKFADGTEAGTFSDTLAETARALQGAAVSVVTKPGKREGSLELVSVEPVDLMP